MKLQQIRYFLAVTEERNFTRAAARLGVGQPPLSMQIKELELEIGAPLFHRLRSGAELTDAGRAFFAIAKSIPTRAEEAIRAARRAALGETGRLALGVTTTTAMNPAIPSAVRTFKRKYPDVEFRFEEANSLRLIDDLLAGDLDFAIIRPNGAEPATLAVHHLIDEPLAAALPSALASRFGPGEIELAALREHPFIMTPPSAGLGLRNASIRACIAAGFDPPIGPGAPHIAAILSLVSAELGIALVPDSTRRIGIGGVAYRPLKPPIPTVAIAFAHLGENPAQPALNFAKILLAVMGAAKTAA